LDPPLGQKANELDRFDPQSVDSNMGGKGPSQTLLKGGEIVDDVSVLFKKVCHILEFSTYEGMEL
jgi:hypothetical protein